MRSTFSGLEIGKTGLFIAQQQMDVTGHNIANVETKGYSRQRIDTAAIDPLSGTVFLRPMVNGMIGGGVEAITTSQMRDIFLDLQYRHQVGAQRDWQTRYDAIYRAGSLLLDDISDGGLINVTKNFISALSAASSATATQEQRTNLQQHGLALVETFNAYYKELNDIMVAENEKLKVNADRVNDLGTSLAALNKSIYEYELGGERANDLRDKRNLLLDELAGYGDIAYTESTPKGTMEVYFGGHLFVEHTKTDKLVVTTGDTNKVTGASDMYHIEWADGSPLNLTTGEMHGHYQMRDGDTVDEPGIAYFINQLNSYVSTLAKTLNDAHRDGYSLEYTLPDGTTVLSQTGFDFFKSKDGGPITAGNIWLGDEIVDNPNKIQGSAKIVDDPATPGGTGNQGEGNNDNYKIMLEAIQKKIINNTTVMGMWGGILAEIGVQGSHTKNLSDVHDVMVNEVQNQRLSVMGVSLDEEMTNLIRFNQAYSAAARVITAMDEMLDKLINGTGRVGL